MAAVPARVMAMVYVLVVVPFCAVTTTVMRLRPTVRLMLPEALPDATVVPLTLIVAVVSVTVGVTVTLPTVLLTATV